MNTNELLSGAANGDGNVQEKIESATGTYEDKVAEAADQALGGAYDSLPAPVNPTPFTIKGSK